MGLSLLWAWCYQHGLNMLKVNLWEKGRRARFRLLFWNSDTYQIWIWTPILDTFSSCLGWRHSSLPQSFAYQIISMRRRNFVLVSERIFLPWRKLTVGILSWGVGLNSSSGCGFVRRSSWILFSTLSEDDLTPKLSVLHTTLGYHYIFKNVDLMFCIIQVAKII